MIDTKSGPQKCDNIVTGMWKFGPEVSPMSIGMFATEWMQKEGEKLLHLYCRQCSKDQNAIGFMYQFDESDHKPFYHRMTDQLKRRFGNGFVGWDISSPTWIFKNSATVVVTGRSGDRAARLEGRRGVWGHGNSTDEAIGDMVHTHSETFGITLKIEPN